MSYMDVGPGKLLSSFKIVIVVNMDLFNIHK